MEGHIWITTQDRDRLRDCLTVLQENPDKRELPYIIELERELERAQVIQNPAETPNDVITMRSRARLRNMGSQQEVVYTLVYPSEGNAGNGYISVLAPIGAAMLGCRVGNAFEVDLPKGKTQFQVEELLYQPEAAGDYYL